MNRNVATLPWIFWAVHCGGSTPLAESGAPDAAVDVGHDALSVGMDEGDADVQGTANGQTFSSREAMGVVNHLQTSDSSVPNLVTVAIPANFNSTCDQFKQDILKNTTHPNQAVLTIDVAAGAAPLTPGVYAVSNAPADAGAMAATGLFSATDSNCNRTSEAAATAGSVTVTAVDAVAISGMFRLWFQNGDDLAGEFFAPFCYVFVPQTGIAPPPAVCAR